MSQQGEKKKEVDIAEAKIQKDIALRLADEGRLLEAIEIFDKAADVLKDDAGIYYYRGQAWWNLAIRLAGQADTVSEKTEMLTRIENALEDERVAIRLNPNMADAYFVLGACYDSLRSAGMAQLCLEAYLQEIAGLRSIEKAKGTKARQVLDRLGNTRKNFWEIEWLDRAKVYSSTSLNELTDTMVDVGYSVSERRLKTDEEKEHAYQAWKEWAGQAAKATIQRWAYEHFNAALEQSRRGRPRAAIVHLLEGLRYQPEDAEGLLMLGINYEICGYPDRSEYFVKRAMELKPSEEVKKEAEQMLAIAKREGRKVRLFRIIAKAFGARRDAD